MLAQLAAHVIVAGVGVALRTRRAGFITLRSGVRGVPILGAGAVALVALLHIRGAIKHTGGCVQVLPASVTFMAFH